MSERKSNQSALSGVDFARQAAQIAHDGHCEDVVVLDLRGLSSVTDFFVIATGTSDRQMRAIIDHVEEHGRKVGQSRFGLSGYESPTWVLADYVDVVIHLFDAERRQYYDLELLWGDAPRVEWRRSDVA
jgi:ribosome-associated protein